MNRIRDNSLFKGIFYMGFGTIVAQMINVLIQPVLTRIVPAETLGIYTYIVSMANIVIPIASLKLEMLVVSEKSEDEAQYITDACVYVTLFVSALYLAVISIGYNLPSNNAFNKCGYLVFLVPLLVLTNGIRFLFISYNNRYKKYKLITGVAIIREATRAIIQIASGFLSLGVIGQTMGYALSPLFGLKIQMKHYLQLKRGRKLTVPKFKEIIRKGKGQILFLVPGQFINSFASSFVTISIASLFTAEVLGHYSAGVRLLEIPILFITANVNKVCYQRFSENVASNKPIKKTFLTLVIILGCISFSGFGLLFFIAPQLSAFVFGKGYAIAGEYIKCLCLMYSVRLITTSFNGLFTIFGKQRYELGINIALICVAFLAYYVTKMLSGSVFFYFNIIGYGYALIYLLLLVGYYTICEKYDKSIN